MKSRRCTISVALNLFAAFAIPLGLAAQDTTAQAKKAQHHHYKFIDIGTFGGPNSAVPLGFLSLPGETAVRDISDDGTIGGVADTSVSDPLCYIDDCFFPHAFRWQRGVQTDLG